MKLNVSYLVEIGDLEYELGIDNYYPGSRSTWNDPGDGSEIDPSNAVAILARGEPVGYTTWNVLVLTYAADYDLSLSKAEAKLEDALHQAADEAAADYDDGPEYDPED